jgi:hypothetical protein
LKGNSTTAVEPELLLEDGEEAGNCVTGAGEDVAAGSVTGAWVGGGGARVAAGRDSGVFALAGRVAGVVAVWSVLVGLPAEIVLLLSPPQEASKTATPASQVNHRCHVMSPRYRGRAREVGMWSSEWGWPVRL